MTQEDKQLLIQDLCARLPYGVKALEIYYEEVVELIDICPRTHNIEAEILSRIGKDNSLTIQNIQFFKPYLRSMEDMTEDEKKEYNKLLDDCKEQDRVDYNITILDDSMLFFVIDYLNAHHFDYRGLIKRGLAIRVTKENDPYKVI